MESRYVYVSLRYNLETYFKTAELVLFTGRCDITNCSARVHCKISIVHFSLASRFSYLKAWFRKIDVTWQLFSRSSIFPCPSPTAAPSVFSSTTTTPPSCPFPPSTWTRPCRSSKALPVPADSTAHWTIRSAMTYTFGQNPKLYENLLVNERQNFKVFHAKVII